ncbi:amino acid adenylation domain-containing protein, partial [Marininema mesophilum]|uniref:amino acid adenylation domain-containing protein n=1 Tax=Marininema mesophilum TaxID=1048340 RepID=UPI003CCBF1A0
MERLSTLSPEKRMLLEKQLHKNKKREPSPLSYAQQRLWFMDRFTPNSALYNIPGVWRLRGEWSIESLEKGLNALIERHEVLRTVIREVDGQPVQQIQPFMPRKLPVIHLMDLSIEEREAEMNRLIQEEAESPFDLAQGPLMRAQCIQVDEKEWMFLCTMHHIISDGWSMGVFLEELLTLYKDEAAELPLLPIQYADFAKWQRKWIEEEGLDTQLQYWQEELSGELPVLQWPTNRVRPVAQTYHGAVHQVHFPLHLVEKLKEVSREEGSTLFMTLLAAYQGFLSRYTGQEDILVGSPIANRNHQEIEGLIGFFVNTLVYRADVSGNPTFRELLAQVRQKALKAYEHQDIPFEKIVEAVQPERSNSHSPIFQTSFTLQDTASRKSRDLSGKTMEPVDIHTSVAKFDLTVVMEEKAEGLWIAFEYNTDLFDGATIERMARHFENWLNEVAYHSDKTLGSLNLMAEEEKQQLLVDWNDTTVVYPRALTVHELFEEQAMSRPEAIAVVYEDQELTYRKLNERANQLAHYLQKQGVGAESLVGLCMDRSPDMIVGLLGILKAGGAYVPLDPTYPLDRLTYMIEHTQIRILLTKDKVADHIQNGSIKKIDLDEERLYILAENNCNLNHHINSSHLSYVMFTSGSTGKPKGVCIPHRGVVRLVKETDYIHFTSDDTSLQVASISFDAATFEIWGSLLNGGKLVLFPGSSFSLEELGKVIQDSSITIMCLTTSLFHQVVDFNQKALHGVKQLLVGGDVLSAAHVRKVLQSIPGCRVINGYGPTENTTCTCSYSMTDPDEVSMSIPIGRPIANTSVYILDRNLQPVPVGIPGELYVGGDGLAHGYLYAEQQTAEKFIPHPFSEHPEEKLYKTGDLVRYLPDGNLEFLGRIDNQVKIRGFRIELGEIEGALNEISSIQESVVMVQEYDRGDKRLVAYVVGEGSVAEWKAHLSDQLPSYMVPAYFVVLDAFPLTSNGKIDRKALPIPDGKQVGGQYIAPRTPLEELVVSVWEPILGLENIGAQDSFFELGGHSLLATQVASRLQEAFQIELSIRELFAYPTVEALATRLDELRQGEKATLPPLKPMERTEPVPLSYAQQRLWFIDRFTPNSALYNIPGVWRLKGDWSIEGLEKGLNALIERHEVLRTVIHEVDGQPVQQVPPFMPKELPVINLMHLSFAEREAEMHRLIQEEAELPFDLAQGPLMRAKCIQIDEKEWMFLCTMHHIISDGWSMGVFLEELLTLYKNVLDESPAEKLPPLPIQYADFAQWQRKWMEEEGLDTQLQYWQEELSGELPVLQWPTNRVRPVEQTYRGAVHQVLLPPYLVEKLKEVSREEGSTLFMTLLAAYQGFLSRYTGQDDILVGSPIANRNHQEIEGLIGFFVNTLVYRADVSGNPTFRDLLAQVRQKALKAYEHQDIPFEKIVEAVQPERSTSHSPIFQTLFTLQDTASWKLPYLPGKKMELVDNHVSTAKFDLTVAMVEKAEGLWAAFEYNTDLFDRATIERMARHFENWLHEVAHHSEKALGSLDLMAEEEKQQLLVEWNDTTVAYPQALTIHELFEEQAMSRPEAIAVVYEDQQLTYRELNERASQLAHYLQKQGVGSESLVGLCVDRSPDMVVGLLGILKAGGAYVPLDPTYPEKRLQYIVEDAGIQILVTQAHLQEQEKLQKTVKTIYLDQDQESIARESVLSPKVEVTAQNLAYVIYTSGSTGNPKGVMVEHRNVIRLFQATEPWYQFNEQDTWTLFHSYAFDFSVWELWGALLYGGRLVVVPYWISRSPKD